MYYLLTGEANVKVKRYDKLLKEYIEEDSGVISSGTMFGEVSLLHGTPRLATITSISRYIVHSIITFLVSKTKICAAIICLTVSNKLCKKNLVPEIQPNQPVIATSYFIIDQTFIACSLSYFNTEKIVAACELLMVLKEDFDRVLKATVLSSWDEITKIMNQLAYFRNYDDITRKECSILSRTKVSISNVLYYI